MLAQNSTVVLCLIARNPFLPEMVLTLIVPILLVAIVFHLLPNLTRRDIFFAVTVDQAFRKSAEARNIIRRFRLAIWIHTAIALAILFAGVVVGNPFVTLIGIPWQIIGATHAFLRARKQIMPHSATPISHREAALVPRTAGGVGFAFLQMGPFAILAVSAVYIRAIWYRIPERFPIHWDLNGNPNGWATRSFMGIYGFWMIGVVICIFIEVFAYGTLHWTRQIRASGSDAQSEAHFRRVQVGVLLALEYFFALVFNGIPASALGPHPEQAPNIGPFVIGTFAFVAVLCAILIRTGQGGANLSRAGAGSAILEQKGPIGDRTPDRCWKAGMFYVNPSDPAVLVEKRFGIGYTLNFGRPAAWLLLGLILASAAIPLVIALVSVHAR
jgi:uncharacterized membrane protein